MKYAFIAAAMLTASLSQPTLAADSHEEHHHGMSMTADQTAVTPTDGTVKKVDKAAGKITVTHGPLENLGMPAMTMAFRVKDPAWLEQMKEGDHIRFVADNVEGALTIVRLESVR